MISLFTNNKGETIAETIVALSILALGITVASTVIVNALRNMDNAKNRIVAVNLAREGLEALRNVRDTNWLMYSDRRRACWNHDPSITPCEGLNPIAPGTYVVYRNAENRFKLTLYNEENIKLFLVDVDSDVDSDQDGNAENDPDLYNHMNGVDNPLGKESGTTNFKRTVQIEYLDNASELKNISQNEVPEDAINSLAEWNNLSDEQKMGLNRMRITSTVEWVRSGVTHHTELKTILTDHLGRTELGT